MPIEHKKEFGVYLWDTFDNETMLIKEFDSFDKARAFVEEKYGRQISPNGADVIEIVDSHGEIKARWTIT